MYLRRCFISYYLSQNPDEMRLWYTTCVFSGILHIIHIIQNHIIHIIQNAILYLTVTCNLLSTKKSLQLEAGGCQLPLTSTYLLRS